MSLSRVPAMLTLLQTATLESPCSPMMYLHHGSLVAKTLLKPFRVQDQFGLLKILDISFWAKNNCKIYKVNPHLCID